MNYCQYEIDEKIYTIYRWEETGKFTVFCAEAGAEVSEVKVVQDNLDASNVVRYLTHVIHSLANRQPK